jgi:mRNA interferase MazF
MTRYSFGAVILVPFPFTDQSASKKRPAVVINSAHYATSKPDVILMAITSQLRSEAGAIDVQLADWQGAGLLKPSAIKPVIATIEQSLIDRQLGALGADDEAELRALIVRIVG